MPPLIRLAIASAFLLLGAGCEPEGPAQATAPQEPAQPVERPDPFEVVTDGDTLGLPAETARALISEDSLWAEALRIHYNAIVIDGHIDTPTLMLTRGYDLARRHATNHVDLPRMREGGLDGAFFSIYVPARYGDSEAATDYARRLIDEVGRQLASVPDEAQLATSAAEARRIAKSGRAAILLGIEGGHALHSSPEVLREMRALGVRYVTLTHVNANGWADASQSRPRWNGLNELGRQMIAAMNEAGVLVDLAHVSDSTFYQAVEATNAPPIVSHSSARALTYNARNVTDDMARAVAGKGGVIMVNFFPPMVNTRLTEAVMREAYLRIDTTYGGNLRQLFAAVYATKANRGIGRASRADVVRHIDHLVRTIGIDHVGLGSDFDGARMPLGLEDVTQLPWLTYDLLKLGYSEEDLYKLLGGNALRVLEAAETYATRVAPEPSEAQF
ncbi:MAG: dipeptidase [Bacteroidota bacterium]